MPSGLVIYSGNVPNADVIYVVMTRIVTDKFFVHLQLNQFSDQFFLLHYPGESGRRRYAY